jgi:hypothetical protein
MTSARITLRFSIPSKSPVQRVNFTGRVNAWGDVVTVSMDSNPEFLAAAEFVAAVLSDFGFSLHPVARVSKASAVRASRSQNARLPAGGT